MSETTINGTGRVNALEYTIQITLAEAIRLGEEAKKIQDEAAIRAGDFVVYDKSIRKIIKVEREMYWFTTGTWIHFGALKKITNPTHITALVEIFE